LICGDGGKLVLLRDRAEGRVELHEQGIKRGRVGPQVLRKRGRSGEWGGRSGIRSYRVSSVVKSGEMKYEGEMRKFFFFFGKRRLFKWN
jgi:hypothetical protein